MVLFFARYVRETCSMVERTLVKRVAIATQMLTNLYGLVCVGRVLPQTRCLPLRQGPQASMTEMVTHLYSVNTIQSTIHPMKRGKSPTHQHMSHTATPWYTSPLRWQGPASITIMQAMTTLTGPLGRAARHSSNDVSLDRSHSIYRESNESNSESWCSALIPVIVTPHLFGMTALTMVYEETIILFMILITTAKELSVQGYKGGGQSQCY